MTPTAATALRWGGAVVGLLLVVWLTVPAMFAAMQASIRFGDDTDAVLDEDAEAADHPPAGDEAADDEGADDSDAETAPTGEGDDDDRDDGPAEDAGDEAGPVALDGSYQVQSGDTLFDIAERTLGDGHRWAEIADLNDLADGRDLRVGQVLELPDR